VSAGDLAIVLPALLAGLLVLATHVPLGQEVLRRGIVFVDLAVAQIAALGVVIAGLAGFDAHGWQVQLAAGLAAMAGALLLTWTEKRWPEVQEAQIGVIFVLAASGGLLLLAHHPQGGEHLRDLLTGQILWVSYAQLALPTALTALLVAALCWRPAWAGRLGFYAALALAVTLSVQLLGVYLVFASLIVPALGVRHYPARRRLPLAFLGGAAGYASGLILSLLSDLPAGALIVWCQALIAALTYALGPKPTFSGT